MDSDDQPPARKIEFVESPVSAAFDAAAPLVEWALKMDISMPASQKDFIHLPTVLPETGKCGATRPMKSKLLF